jgi:hypothetical protein
MIRMRTNDRNAKTPGRKEAQIGRDCPTVSELASDPLPLCGFASLRLKPVRSFIQSAALLLLAMVAFADASTKLYENNFEKAEVDKVPEDFLVLDGGFAVKQEEGNKFLELPGAPLETFGVLFGPTEAANISVLARVFGTGKGRRFPAFAIGANGVGGVRLQVSAAKKQIELFKADEVVAAAPFTWESGAWTALRLQVRKIKEGEIRVQGKAWKHDAKEPEKWLIDHTINGDLPAGRASVWGNPFSGTPIRFDDLSVAKAESP